MKCPRTPTAQFIGCSSKSRPREPSFTFFVNAFLRWYPYTHSPGWRRGLPYAKPRENAQAKSSLVTILLPFQTKRSQMHFRTTKTYSLGWWRGLPSPGEDNGPPGWIWREPNSTIVLYEMFDPAQFPFRDPFQIDFKQKWWRANYAKMRALYPRRTIIALSPQYATWAHNVYKELRARFEGAGFGVFGGEKPMSGFYAILYCLQVCKTPAGKPLFFLAWLLSSSATDRSLNVEERQTENVKHGPSN